jgi:outer membrane murein-binding lipoprotein Lpp
MTSIRPMRRLALVCAATLLAGCVNPRVQENMAQAMTEFGNELAVTRQDLGYLQNTIDSLRQVVAKQDTIIGRLATLAGLPR